jgi:hypothetical protein
MAHTLTIKLPDEIYEYVCEMALKADQSPAEWVVDRVEAITPGAVFLTPAERAEAKAKLMRHVGAVSIPDATGADNEAIDRDLADEYGSTHEDDR